MVANKTVMAILVGLMWGCTPVTTPTVPPETATTMPVTTTSTAGAPPTGTPGVVVLDGFDAGGVGGSGQTASPLDLYDGVTYSFAQFIPPFVATPPSTHWAVGRHDSLVVLLEWAGENGQRPGSLYVMVFDAAEGSVDEGWARLETGLDASLTGLGTGLEWVAQGSGDVGGIPADWREMRTPPEVTRPGGWPCVVSLPGGCVWTDATARFYVVPLGQFTATVVVYENRCACEVGESYSKFARGANELHDWTEMFEELLRSFDFAT